jgi:hypothetical protein
MRAWSEQPCCGAGYFGRVQRLALRCAGIHQRISAVGPRTLMGQLGLFPHVRHRRLFWARWAAKRFLQAECQKLSLPQPEDGWHPKSRSTPRGR